MTAGKAIAILTGNTQYTISEFNEAVRLGTEALKRCRDNYLNPQRADFRRLPGETEK